jgi:hypothetical protein
MDINRARQSLFKPTLLRGVIEDNNDPMFLGRCRVRIMGIHTPDIEEVPTDTLPWAEVIAPSLFGNMSGIGVSSVPLNGTWVWLFLDNNEEQHPVVIGTTMGISKVAGDATKGFSDPDGLFPMSDRLDESDFNRLARVDAEKLAETVHQLIIDNKAESVTAGGDSGAVVDFTEKDSTNDASEYPNVTVIETQSGHVIEIDDTIDNERIRIYHTTGTYTEMLSDGSTTTKIIADEEKFVVGDKKTLVEGNKIENTVGNVDIETSGNNTEHVVGDKKHSVAGAETEFVTGDKTKTIAANEITDIAGDKTDTIGGAATETVTGDKTTEAMNIITTSTMDITESCLNKTVEATAMLTMSATGMTTIEGASVAVKKIVMLG